MHDNLEICREHKDNLGNVFHARVRREKSWPEKRAYGGRSGVPTYKAAATTLHRRLLRRLSVRFSLLSALINFWEQVRGVGCFGSYLNFTLL